MSEKYQPDGKIVSMDEFWSWMEWGIHWRYFNNFDLSFSTEQILGKCKNFIDLNNNGERLDQDTAIRFIEEVYWKEYLADYIILQVIAFSEYYYLHPEETQKIMDYVNQNENIHSQVSNNNGDISCIQEDFRGKLYNAYAYMRTQPGTSDDMIIN